MREPGKIVSPFLPMIVQRPSFATALLAFADSGSTAIAVVVYDFDHYFLVGFPDDLDVAALYDD